MLLAPSDATRSSIPLASRRTDPLTLARRNFLHRDRVSLVKPVNVGLMADRAAERFGRSVPLYLDQPFSWDPEQRVELDYVEVAKLIEEMSAVFKAAGVGKWDRVAIVKTPNYDIQSVAWAVSRIGGIPALLSAKLDPEIVNILLDRLQPKVIVTDPDVVKYIGLDPARIRALGATVIADVEGGVPVADLWGGAIPSPSPLKDDEPMMITHTSSTTGVSKMAECSAIGVSFSAMMESVFPLLHTPDDLFASIISHVHVRAAVTQQASFSRGTPVLGIGNPVDETILRLFERYRPTIIEAHPNQFLGWERIIDDPVDPFATIRLFLNTFDAIHPRTIRKLLDASKRSFPLWFNCYGMTETQVVSVRGYTRGMARRPAAPNDRSVGWPVPGVRVRIADPETGERRRNQREPGMIQVKTRARALSFVGTPEKFSERRHGKWFDTGDWGRRGRWGQIDVLDRIADRIDNVDSCLGIEDVLLDRIPDAEEIVVVPDGDGNAAVVVCMRDGATLTDDAWRAASAGIPNIRGPYVMTQRELHRTATVKARRYLLTELIKSGDLGAVTRPDVVLREGA